MLEALRDKEESVRVNAAYALGKIRAESAAGELSAVLKNDDEEDELRQAASDALREIGTSEARAAARAWERQKKREVDSESETGERPVRPAGVFGEPGGMS